MPNLSENPHLAQLLEKQGLTIDPTFIGGVTLSGDLINVGTLRPQGTVVGFSVSRGPEMKILALVYDESKEGQDDAITTEECRL